MENAIYDQIETQVAERLTRKFTEHNVQTQGRLDQLLADLEEIKAMVRKRIGLPQQEGFSKNTQEISCSNQIHKSARGTQTPAHSVSEHLFFAPTEIGEDETTQSHKLIPEGGNFTAIADSVSVVVDQIKEPIPEVSTDPTPLLPPLNPPTPDSLIEKGGSATETRSELSQGLTALPQPEPPNTNLPDFMKRKNPLKMQVKLAPTWMARMSLFWIRKLRVADPELDWEKLKRALFDGSLLNTPLEANSDTTISTSFLDSPWVTYLLGAKSLPIALERLLRVDDIRNAAISQKVCLFFREDEHLQEAYAAAMIYLPHDPWYVEVYTHFAFDLLADWFYECRGFVSFPTLEHSKFPGFISYLTIDGVFSIVWLRKLQKPMGPNSLFRRVVIFGNMSELTTKVGFIQWLGPDMSIKVLTHLDALCDLVCVAADSSSWQRFVIENGLHKKLCLKLFPEKSGVAISSEVDNMIEPVSAMLGNCMNWECFTRTHKVYAILAMGLTPMLKNCISKAISAPSIDNYPEQNILTSLELVILAYYCPKMISALVNNLGDQRVLNYCAYVLRLLHFGTSIEVLDGRIYGPYKVLGIIGAAASQLELPPNLVISRALCAPAETMHRIYFCYSPKISASP